MWFLNKHYIYVKQFKIDNPPAPSYRCKLQLHLECIDKIFAFQQIGDIQQVVIILKLKDVIQYKGMHKRRISNNLQFTCSIGDWDICSL